MGLVAGMLCLHGLSLFHPEGDVLVIEATGEKNSHLAMVSFPVCLLTILIGTRVLQYTADGDHAHSHDPDTFTV